MRDRRGEWREKRRGGGATSIRGSTCSRVRTTLEVSALLSRKQAIVHSTSTRVDLVSPLSPIEIGDATSIKERRREGGGCDEGKGGEGFLSASSY